MAIELYIANELMDLDDSVVIATSYQQFDVADITKVKFDYTNTFTLPFTYRNNLFFENSWKVQSQSERRFATNVCKLVNDGFTILENGVAEYLGSDEKGYKVNCYSAELELFQNISGQKLVDLDLDYLNHTVSIANVITSQTATSGYIYPLIDWHVDSPNALISATERKIDIRFMLPCYFYEQILEQIFTEQGFTLNNLTKLDSFFDGYDLIFTTDNKNTYLLFVIKNTTTQIPTASGWGYFSGSFHRWGVAIDIVSDFLFGNAAMLETIEKEWNVISTYNGTTNNEVPITFIVPPSTTTYNIDFTFVMQSSIAGQPDFVRFSIGRNTDDSDIYDDVYSDIVSGAGYPNYNFNANITLTAGVKYCVIISSQDAALDSEFSISEAELYVKQSIQLADSVMPDMEQTDFIKAYLQLTGSTIEYDIYQKKYTIKPFNTIVDNKPIANDWTDKVHNDSKPSIVHKVGKYGVANELKYKDDKADIKPINTDGFVNSTNQNLNKYNKVLELPFAGSPMNSLLRGLNIPKVSCFKQKTGTLEVTIGADTITVILPLLSEKSDEVTPRILLLRRETLPVFNPMGFTDDGTNYTLTNQVALCHFIDSSQTSSLGFGSNVIANFYQWLTNILDDTIAVDQTMKLSYKDIAELDFSKPVYFTQHNAFFYINKISNFIRGKLTKAQFIKI